MDYDIIVNVQGDEPLIKAAMIDDVISSLDDSRASIGTLAIRIKEQSEIFNPNVVKAVFNEEGFAFYFSRAPIPYHRDLFSAAVQKPAYRTGKCRSLPAGQTGAEVPTHHSYPYQGEDRRGKTSSFKSSGLFVFKHIGIYSYRKDVLVKLSEMPPSRLELIEKLEQLRALENGFRIKVKETYCETFGVDTPEDLERVEKWLNISL